MATRDTGQGAAGLSRRDFLKSTAAATAVVGCGLDVAFDAAKAFAYEGDPTHYQITATTCPYCSASCGQRVVTDITSGSPTFNKVVDIYGDFESPMNSGGLCSKGAGTLQLVNNPRRVGAFPGTHPVTGSLISGNVFAYASGYSDGVAYRREGDNAWSQVALDAAMTEIASGMVTARGTLTTGAVGAGSNAYNSKGVAFFGSSHINNESNYIYRKLIANFGSSNVEHQARI